MKLLGDWNWYLPSWLEWLPRVAPESAAPPPAVVSPHGAAGMSADVRRSDGQVSLTVRGELDLETAPAFRDQLAAAELGTDTLIVDLRGVTFIDSCGLGELVGAHQRAHREGRRIVVVLDEDTPLDRVLHLTGLDKRIETSTAPIETSQ
jgi:anti-sigma B factor antagonist